MPNAWRVVRIPRRGETGHLQEQVGGLHRHFAVMAADHPGHGDRASGIRDDGHAAVERALHAIEGHQPLARLRLAHDDTALPQPTQVEGVHRLPESVHEIVGRVDHVVDRSQPHRFETPHQPLGTRAHGDAAHHQTHVAGTAGAIVNAHRHSPARALALVQHRSGQEQRCRLFQLRRLATGNARQRRQLARHAQVGEQIGAVGQHVHVEPHVTNRDRLEQRRTGRHVHRQRHDSLVVLAQPQLARRAEHAVGHGAADLSLLERQAAGQHVACAGERIQRSGGHVGRTADDVQQGPAAVIHPRHPEVVGVRVPRGLHHARHDHRRQVLPQSLHSIHRGDVRRDEVAHRLRRQIVGNERPQPVVGNEHQPNCSRKRRSESYSRRMSGMP